MAGRYYNKRDKYGRWSNGSVSKPPVRRSGSKSGRAAGSASRSATGVPTRRQQSFEARQAAAKTAKRKATVKKVAVGTATVAAVAVGAYALTRNPSSSGKMAQAVNKNLFVSPGVRKSVPIAVREGALGPGKRASYVKAAKTSASVASSAASVATGVSSAVKDVKQATRKPSAPSVSKAEPIGVSPQLRRKGDAFREHINSKEHGLGVAGLSRTVTPSVSSHPVAESGPKISVDGGKASAPKTGEMAKSVKAANTEVSKSVAKSKTAVVDKRTGTALPKKGSALASPLSAGTAIPDSSKSPVSKKSNGVSDPKRTPVVGGVSSVKAESAAQKIRSAKPKVNPASNPSSTKAILSDGAQVKLVTQMSREERAALYQRGAKARQDLIDRERAAKVKVGSQELADFERKNPQKTMYASIKGNVVHEGATRTPADEARAKAFADSRKKAARNASRRVAKELTGEDARIEELEGLIASGSATRADRVELKRLMG